MRRLFLLVITLMLAAASHPYAVVQPGRPFSFPADHGAHPDFRTEWWYVTGIVRTDDGHDLGFQITFFRTRPPIDLDNPSRFAARQILFAHVALSDPAIGHLLSDQRAARGGFGIAEARVGDADIRLRDWQLKRMPDGRFAAHVVARGFSLDLTFRPTQPPMLQGVGGYSRKGPRPTEASAYYSLPQMAVSGSIARKGLARPVTGKAWIDREWSTHYLDPLAVGWDWTGLNFDDGGALMAFRIRRADGSTLWAGGSYRRADGRITVFAPGDVVLQPVRTWRSARTGAAYPVAQWLFIRLPEGVRRLPLVPLFADQELDARSGGLPVYWEGAVRTRAGSGYLELTGYAAPLKM